jgi:deazaflavin-dependent oxidoreductase (nitroreductase family)
MFKGASMILLHTIGAKSGQERVNPLVYQADGDRYVIFASFAGSPTNPAWYHNLIAHPDVTVEVGSERFSVHARVAEGDERDRLWARQKERVPTFAEYETKTTRAIPVIVLERTSG